MLTFLFLAILALSWRGKAQTMSSGTVAPNSTTTIYYGPVIVTAMATCTSQWAYISMEPVTEAFDVASTISPWSVATITTTSKWSAETTPFVQVNVFLPTQPYSMTPSGEENNWAKACYDPRNSDCPEASPVGGPENYECLPVFPGAQLPEVHQQTQALPTGGTETLRPIPRAVTFLSTLASFYLGVLLWL